MWKGHLRRALHECIPSPASTSNNSSSSYSTSTRLLIALSHTKDPNQSFSSSRFLIRIFFCLLVLQNPRATSLVDLSIPLSHQSLPRPHFCGSPSCRSGQTEFSGACTYPMQLSNETLGRIGRIRFRRHDFEAFSRLPIRGDVRLCRCYLSRNYDVLLNLKYQQSQYGSLPSGRNRRAISYSSFIRKLDSG